MYFYQRELAAKFIHVLLVATDLMTCYEEKKKGYIEDDALNASEEPVYLEVSLLQNKHYFQILITVAL